jgi:23S rRNA (cytosine1962-C5)-methyltransferase
VWGEPPSEPIHFTENGLAFAADVVQGQKTGFFLDQRDNRARVRGLAAGKRVLNVFAYTGGFSVYAAAGGAREVVSLDVSAPALAHAARNFALNQALPAVAACQHSTWAADAFEALAGLAAQPPFDLVVVDPPALAKQAAETQPALRAYERLTRLSLAALAPGGTLVIASCSSRVSAVAFFAAVQRAARAAGRPLVEFDRTGHAIDHPVRFPEGAYLKCVYATA